MKLLTQLAGISPKLERAREDTQQRRYTDFWRQCVRDASNSWTKHNDMTSRFGTPYFYGHQAHIQYGNDKELAYLLKNIGTRQKFYAGLPRVLLMTVEEFRAWLEDLRHSMQYRPHLASGEWLHERFVTSSHTKIVKEDVLPLSKKYNDPYYTGKAKGPHFTFEQAALPHDELDGEVVLHHYPTLDYAPIYLEEALSALKQIIDSEILTNKEYIFKVAYFYQLLINLHLFAEINASLYMNLANGLLELRGFNGIEHGIIDFVALRLQPGNFQRYFYDTVIAGQ